MASALSSSYRVMRAFGTNQVARLFPSTYVRLTGQTGRGDRSGETPEAVASYFLRCFAEYFETLSIPPAEIATFLEGKSLLEYGPGDLPGVALIMVAFGARSVVCVDRFPLVRFSEFSVATLRELVRRLPASAAERAWRAFRDRSNFNQGFNDDRIKYLVRRDGLSGLHGTIDLAVSRAVLEHVNDLTATFADMSLALRPGGVAIHLVDLKSHGLHQSNPLDFLTWPEWLWNLMYSAKGVPNRWRIDRYVAEVRRAELELKLLQSTGSYAAEDVAAVRPRLAQPFRALPDETIACKGCWLVCRKPD